MIDRLAKLEQLHAADPKDADLTYMIALEHGKAARHADAVRWFDQTLALDPHYHYAYFQKAKALAAMGDEDAAKQTLQLGLDHANKKGDIKAAGELAGLMETLGE